MGCCCSIHAADEEADAEANWTEEQPCQCLRQYSFTTSLTWEVVPITIYVGFLGIKGFINFFSIKHCCYGEEEETREAVQVCITTLKKRNLKILIRVILA
jgi:hypothetical protein